ncbi:MAG: caspase family protein [Saprospiraceae bacterium]|nr:caspase family protein [Saprospiraceae bacterium]
MNNCFKILCLSLAGLFWMAQAYGQADRKKALLIGVGKYPEAGGWNSLSSMNDIDLVTKTLLDQGFKKENILILSDEQANKQNILKTITQDFYNKVRPGDIIYFQFSGHGQQAADQNGDEIDGLDECIVPYDSPKKFQSGVNEGEKLIRDEELGQAMENLREKVGPTGHVLVVLDACHSGTGTRGFSQARGTTDIMASPDYLKNNGKKLLAKENNEIKPKSRGGEGVKPLAPMVSFFGSAQNQLNYEMTDEAGQSFGSLSYALTQSIFKVKEGSSYRALFDKIRNEMSRIAPLQQPQVEGELDMDVFNGKMLGKASYFRVLKVLSDHEITINGGQLHGLNKGAIVGLFPADTRDYLSATPMVTGTLTKAFATQSTITLDSALGKNLSELAWVYVLEQSFGDLTIPIGFKMGLSDLEMDLKSWLLDKPFIKHDQQGAKIWFEYPETKPGAMLRIITSDGYPIDSVIIASDLKTPVIFRNKLVKKLRQYLQGQFMKKMEMEAAEIKVTFKIVPVDSIREGMSVDELPALNFGEDGAKKLKVGSLIRILVQNEGIKPAYFNMIDLQPDNLINPLIPGPNDVVEPEELRILPGQKLLMSQTFEIGAPYGQEMFKLIASTKPIDLRSTLGTRGFKQTSPFEKLFMETKDEEIYQTRGGKALSLPSGDINIYSDTFIITENQ